MKKNKKAVPTRNPHHELMGSKITSGASGQHQDSRKKAQSKYKAKWKSGDLA